MQNYDSKIYDSIIIGAGPAGMTAAIYLLRAGKSVLLLEKSTIGGGITSTPLIENYPGYLKISGEELADNLYNQVMTLGGELEVYEASKIENSENIKTVFTDGPEFKGKSIIIATGTKYRRLGLPREEDFIGHGISFCVTCDGAFYKGQTVAVIGGGNSAVTTALTLAKMCKKVIVVQNLADITAENVLSNKLKKAENVEVIYNAVVKELDGDNDLNKIVVTIDDGKHEKFDREISVDGMFISIGLIPSSEFLNGLITLNKQNYVEAGENCNTNENGIFVAGDVRNKAYHQITTSTSDGTVAALETAKYLEK